MAFRAQLKETEKYLLDGNCFDFLARNPEDFKAISIARASSYIEIIGTHVEADEMMRVEKTKPEYATELAKIRHSLSIRKVQASGFVFEISKLDEATLFGWDEIDDFVEMTNDNPRHAEDALLVRTARKENAVLVTEEKSRLPRIAQERHVSVITTSELAEICRKLVV
jgi:predicted nucleic acid-binding protein